MPPTFASLPSGVHLQLFNTSRSTSREVDTHRSFPVRRSSRRQIYDTQPYLSGPRVYERCVPVKEIKTGLPALCGRIEQRACHGSAWYRSTIKKGRCEQWWLCRLHLYTAHRPRPPTHTLHPPPPLLLLCLLSLCTSFQCVSLSQLGEERSRFTPSASSRRPALQRAPEASSSLRYYQVL